MRKTRIFLPALLAAALLLSGCDDANKPLAQRAGQVIDMGELSLPNTTNRLHGYRLTNGDEHDHFVYVLVDSDGQPIAGTRANSAVSAGKTTRNQAVTLELAREDSAASSQAEARSRPQSGAVTLDVKLTCDSVEQCQRKLAAMQQAR